MKNLKALGFLVIGIALSFGTVLAQAPEHYTNPPENVNLDPNFTPGDFPMEDTNKARTLYQTQRAELASRVEGTDGSDLLFTLNAGEIAFSAAKNGTAKVLGYFRNYFGVAKVSDSGFQGLNLVIDINSLDTAVPGRNNRILEIFFQSMKPELGYAQVAFDHVDLKGGNWQGLEEGKVYEAQASGRLTLNGVTHPIATKLNIQKKKNLWLAETAKPLILQISDFNLAGRVPELMKSCNHQSVGNAVEVTAKLYLK